MSDDQNYIIGEEYDDLYEYSFDPACLKPGDFFENCNYQACVVLEIDKEKDKILYVSLMPLDSSIGNCSIHHCGVVKIKDIKKYLKTLPYQRETLKLAERGLRHPSESEIKKYKQQIELTNSSLLD